MSEVPGNSPRDIPRRLLQFFHQREPRKFNSQPTLRNTRAGFPATTVLSGTSFVTTLPAPTMAFSPMVTPQRIVELVPIEAPFLTTVGTTFQSASDCSDPSALADLGYLSLMNETLCPMNTLSSIFTPSQMNVWLETFTLFPITAFFWISTKVPILELSPIVHP